MFDERSDWPLNTFELCDDRGSSGIPLVDDKLSQLRRYHDVPVLHHVKHVCDHVLLLWEQIVVAEVVGAIAQTVNAGLLERPSEE